MIASPFRSFRQAMPLFFAVIFILTGWGFTPLASGQEPSVIPMPASLTTGTGNFALINTTGISIPSKQPEAAKVAAYLVDQLKPSTGFTLKVSERPADNDIQLQLGDANSQLGKEGYQLDVTEKKIVVRANTSAGLFYGVQTLLQLLPKEIESKSLVNAVEWRIPAVKIVDYPRFAWRGIMLDVSRHFFSKEYLKDYIDQLARYKFNLLHLHLTDDNGWRVEIKSLPKLTQVGAWRVPRTGTFGSNEAPKPGEKPTDGGFYTHEDIKEIVQYAKDRYIDILPEIDVPGHSMAAIAAYPELCVTKDSSIHVNPGSNFSKWFGRGKFEMYIDNTLNPTDEKVYQFLDKVFTEVAMLFPFEYIHMGGDECYKGYWERDANVQAFMKKNNIKDSEGLQSYFTKRVSKILESKKKKLIGWDEILEGGLAPGAAVMSWRGTKGGIEASHQKHPVVMSPSPEYYLDMMQGDASIEAPVYNSARLKDVYQFDILAPGIDSTYVVGAQANLWTEQIPTTAQVEYMTYPRTFAVAETIWSPRNKKNWNGFVSRVENHFQRFDQAGINYSPSLYDAIIRVKKDGKGQLVIDLTTEVEGLNIYYTVDNSIPNHYHPRFKESFVFPSGADNLKVITYRDNKPVGRLISLKAEDLEKRVKK
jgi:hexosaminidase